MNPKVVLSLHALLTADSLILGSLDSVSLRSSSPLSPGSLVSLATRLTREPYPPPTLPLTTLYIPSHPIPLPPTRGPAFGLPSGPRVRGNDSG